MMDTAGVNDRIEPLILKNLIYNEDYTRKVIPYLKDYHFDHVPEREIFSCVQAFFEKYNNLPTRQAIRIEIDRKSLPEKVYESCTFLLKKLKLREMDVTDYKWLIDRTEDFCQEKEIAYALNKSIDILENPKMKGSRGEITSLLTHALGISFDPNVGHDYFDDTDEAYDHYIRVEEKFPFDIELLNKATDGGVEKGSLNIILAGTGVGKTLTKASLAASYLMQGKNVLYITLEMGKFQIRRRIDANLLDVPMNEIRYLEKDKFLGLVKSLHQKTNGSLVVRQYPTATASVLNFRSLLDELRLKKKFIPDILVIDYLNICTSSRIKQSAQAGSFAYMKAISEELKGLAVERDLPIWTSVQANREGMKSNDIDLTNTGESIGIPQNADLMIALMPTTDVGVILVKVLKNRYDDIHRIQRFYVKVDRKKMRISDYDEAESFEIPSEEFSAHHNGNGHSNGHMNGNGKRKLLLTKTSLTETLKKFKGRGAYT